MPPAAGPEADAALLARFVADRDEAAFAALVERHGPMVLRVAGKSWATCTTPRTAFRRPFSSWHKGFSRRPASLASFLHGVALRVARKAYAARRTSPGKLAVGDPPDPGPDPLNALTAREMLHLLDVEVRACRRCTGCR